MERREMVIDACYNVCMESFYNRTKSIIEDLNANYYEMLKEFIVELDNLFIHAINMQKENKKSEIDVVYFSFLHSNFLIDKFGYQVNLYDDRFFLDNEEVYISWKPKIIFDGLDEDFKTIENSIRKKGVRLKEYEWLEIKQGYIVNFYVFSQSILKAMLPYVEKMKSFRDLKKKESVKFMIGEYMDEFELLYEYKGKVEVS